MATFISSARHSSAKSVLFCKYNTHLINISSYPSLHRILRKYTSCISDILNDEELPKSVTVKGWIRSVRQHKDTVFLSLHDGTSRNVLQVVAQSQQTNGVTFGACVAVSGDIVPSPFPQQRVEMKARNVELLGECDPIKFPIKARMQHSPEYIRQLPHLRPKTSIFSGLLRVRNDARVALHKYFQDNNYYHIDTPVITTNDCEGAGEAFHVKTEKEVNNPSDEAGVDFFSGPAYLTVSGQLHLEVAVGAFPRVYTLGPTFRAEKSMSRHHLSEFYMLEAEVGFIDDLSDLTMIIEDTVKTITQNILDTSYTDVAHFWGIAGKGQEESILKMLDSSFLRISYTEAIRILEKQNDSFQYKVAWGEDLHKEHERHLVKYCDNRPVFVHDYPASLKPFYAKQNHDQTTVAACDLLVPGVGELVGGSLRNTDHDSLCQRLEEDKLATKLQWYLDLRKFGCSPHGGFGMGFERYMQYLLGVKHIRDVIPFPRSLNNCKL